MSSQVTNQDTIIITDEPFVISSNKRYQSIRFHVHLSCPIDNVKLFIGVVHEPANK